jgi:uncharacterized protein (UPF0333 family)
MKKFTIQILVMAALLVAGGCFSYYYIMHGGKRDVATEATDFVVSSLDITAEFATNIDVSNKKYLEKALEVTGVITSVSNNEVIINNTIVCNFKEPIKIDLSGKDVIVKGRVVGYDDLLGELKLDQCTLIKNKM